MRSRVRVGFLSFTYPKFRPLQEICTQSAVTITGNVHIAYSGGYPTCGVLPTVTGFKKVVYIGKKVYDTPTCSLIQEF